MTKLLYYWARKKAFSLLLINLFTLCLSEGVEAAPVSPTLGPRLDRELDGENINGYATAVLEKLIIRRTKTKDLGKEEGRINFSINGENTSLFWSGRTNSFLYKLGLKSPKPIDEDHDILLFAGKVDEKSWFAFKASMVESDKKTADKLSRAANVIKGFSSLGAVVPAYGGAVSKGFRVIGSLTEFIGSLQDNDQEFEFGEPFNEGEASGIRSGLYKLVMNRGKVDNDIEAHIRVQEYRAEVPSWLKPKTNVRVLLKDFSPDPDLCKILAKKKGSLRLEFNVAGQIVTREFLANVFKKGRIFSIKNEKLYEGPWLDIMPMAMSLVSASGKKKRLLQGVHDLFSQVTGLVGEFTPGTDVDDKVLSAVNTVSGALIAGMVSSTEDVVYASNKCLINGVKDERVQKGQEKRGTVERTMKLHEKGKYRGDIAATLYVVEIPGSSQEEGAAGVGGST